MLNLVQQALGLSRIWRPGSPSSPATDQRRDLEKGITIPCRAGKQAPVPLPTAASRCPPSRPTQWAIGAERQGDPGTRPGAIPGLFPLEQRLDPGSSLRATLQHATPPSRGPTYPRLASASRPRPRARRGLSLVERRVPRPPGAWAGAPTALLGPAPPTPPAAGKRSRARRAAAAATDPPAEARRPSAARGPHGGAEDPPAGAGAGPARRPGRRWVPGGVGGPGQRGAPSRPPASPGFGGRVRAGRGGRLGAPDRSGDRVRPHTLQDGAAVGDRVASD